MQRLREEIANCHKFTIDVTCVQKGVQLVTKVSYYLEFSYIYKQLIINKKALCLITEGCTFSLYKQLGINNLRGFIFRCIT